MYIISSFQCFLETWKELTRHTALRGGKKSYLSLPKCIPIFQKLLILLNISVKKDTNSWPS